MGSYPPEVRQAIGGELLDTASEASAGSISGLLSETGSLVGGGIRARARLVVRVGSGRLIADGACLAGVWWLALVLAGEVVVWLTAVSPAHLIWWRTVLVVLALTLALTGNDRPAGVLGLARILLRSRSPTLELVIPSALLLDVVPTLLMAVMIWRPRQRGFRWRSLLWLAAAPAIAPLIVPHRILPLHGAGAILMVIVLLVAAVALTFDPRLAIACVLITAELGLVLQRYATEEAQHPIGIAMIAMAPIVVGLTWRRAGPRRVRS
jgi:hypothetical protein